MCTRILYINLFTKKFLVWQIKFLIHFCLILIIRKKRSRIFFITGRYKYFKTERFVNDNHFSCLSNEKGITDLTYMINYLLSNIQRLFFCFEIIFFSVTQFHWYSKFQLRNSYNQKLHSYLYHDCYIIQLLTKIWIFLLKSINLFCWH